MKKIFALALIAFALLCYTPIKAQSKLPQPIQRERGISMGINGTFNTTTMVESAGSHFLEYFFGPGYGVGLFVNVPFAKRFSFQGEIEYDRFKAIDGNWDGGGSSVYYMVSEAISVPLLIQYEFGKKRNTFLNFGPELRFNTRAFNKSPRESPSDYYRYDREAMNPVSLAFAVGIGMRLPIAKKFDFLWEIRLSSDLTSLSRELDYRWEFGQEHRYDFNDDENFRRLNLAIKAGFAYRF